jgi:hypothetical protein
VVRKEGEIEENKKENLKNKYMRNFKKAQENLHPFKIALSAIGIKFKDEMDYLKVMAMYDLLLEKGSLATIEDVLNTNSDYVTSYYKGLRAIIEEKI